MTLRQYIAIMLLATLLCWVAWGVVVNTVDPYESPAIGFAFFYGSLFLSLLGTAALLAFLCYRLFSRSNDPMFRFVQKSFRDGVVVAAVATILLFLQGAGFLRLWNMAALGSCIIIYIFYRLSLRRTPGVTQAPSGAEKI